jgi:hypothetical protein
VDNVRLEVGSTTAKDLSSMYSLASYYRRVVQGTRAKAGVVQRLTVGAKEELSHLADPNRSSS